ncbi:hypothetical protein [Capillimicrobium parvum]|uniref:Uncharacterized protein n=1 Tax=Capillimicrobium parvum TaxID=2884022 RepID=A0A9E6XW85_9ACTN|nr:hypothetical protein [Capillimicrobium parvum]UGS35606.1 hypothetical protein DSM104329_01999 [Capillimicrobium parvum]
MRLRRPRHGTIAAYLALFVALGGTSYAAASLPRNSVGTKQLQNQSVTGAKVRNGSLTAADFRRGQAPRGPAGPQGPTGPAGPQGPAGGGSTVGFASIAANGTVNANLSSGITQSMVGVVPGGYCLNNLPASPRQVQVTPQTGFVGPVVANATIGSFGACPSGTQVTIVLTATATNTAVNNGFFISID